MVVESQVHIGKKPQGSLGRRGHNVITVEIKDADEKAKIIK
jgi:hypothetical protein